MPLFKIKNKKLFQIKEKTISLEKDLQEITEKNLEEIFGYTLVSSELSIDSFRFDTLAWDNENKSFIIIEYKKDRNFSIVDQGFSYLSVLLNRKADFILEYNCKFPEKQLEKNDIDWSQSRVVFISPHFTNYQKNSINFKDMAFELYEVKVFENETIFYNRVEAKNATESINLVTKDKKITNVSREIKSYSIDDHFKPDWEKSRALFDIIHERITQAFPDILCSPQKLYIGYKINTAVVLQLVVYKSGILVQLLRVQPKDLNDPEKRTVYQKNSFKYYNKHVTDFKIENEEDIDYAMMLAKQVYKEFVENN
jgi:predicted transport protein